MSGVFLEIGFKCKQIPEIRIEYQGDYYLVNKERRIGAEELKPWIEDQIQEIVVKEKPNVITFEYLESGHSMDFSQTSVFAGNYINQIQNNNSIVIDTFISDMLPEVMSEVEDIVSDFPFYIEHSKNIHGGWFLQRRCPQCHHHIFFSHIYDAMLCLCCDEWLEKPHNMMEEEHPHPKSPSKRKRYKDPPRAKKEIQGGDSSIVFSNRAKYSEYSITETQDGSIVLSNGVDSDLRIKSIKDLVLMMRMLSERMSYNSKLTEERIVKLNNFHSGTKNPEIFKKNSSIDSLIEFLSETLLNYFIDRNKWIAPE